MTLLEEQLAKIDSLPSDAADIETISHELGAFASVLSEAETLGEDEKAAQFRLLRIETEVLASSKSWDNKVSFKFQGTQTMEDGQKQEFEWPDTSAYASEEFDYIRKRFNETTSPYLISEYGFFLFLKDQMRRHDELNRLAAAFFTVGKDYMVHDAAGKPHQVANALRFLENAIRLALTRSKADASLNQLVSEVGDYLLQFYQSWDIQRRETLMALATVSSLIAQNIKSFSADRVRDEVLPQNWLAAQALTATYRYGAVELAAVAEELAKRIQGDINQWTIFRAQQYELLADEAEQTHNLAAVAFVEHSYRLYQALRDAPNTARLAQRYQTIRTLFALTQTVTQVPGEQIAHMHEAIRHDVERNDSQGIIELISEAPMLPALSDVAQLAQFDNNSFLDWIPVSIEDKHGNTVEMFTTVEERKKFKFLNSYGIMSQLGTVMLERFVLAAFDADKLSATTIEEHLKNTWLGEDRVSRISGHHHVTQPIKLIMPGVRALFSELDHTKSDGAYIPDFVASTDSMVLKVEYILRYMCEKLVIPTFRTKDNNIIMEKLLDELLRDLENHLEEADYFFIRYFFVEKSGQNMRNRVAHGLMDDTEYDLIDALIALTVILKLSFYQFQLLATQADVHE